MNNCYLSQKIDSLIRERNALRDRLADLDKSTSEQIYQLKRALKEEVKKNSKLTAVNKNLLNKSE